MDNTQPVDYQIDTNYLFAVTRQINFTPQSEEIILIEPSPIKRLDDFLLINAVKIEKLFAEHHHKFVYLPKFVRDLDISEMMDYNYPGVAIGSSLQGIDQVAKNINDLFYRSARSPLPKEPLLIRYKSAFSNREKMLARAYGRENPAFIFSYFRLPVDATDSEYMELFTNYVNHCGDESGTIQFSISDEQAKRLQEEIKVRVETLRKMGVAELVIESLFKPTPAPLSHLKITSDFKIILSDYNNREIKMPPLAKALYFLYLNHPEGLRFKELQDHRQELKDYYQSISNRVNIFKLRSSINDLVNPTKNSINEKCSIIRASFLNEFDESVVYPYLINNGCDLIKSISLNRSLLIDEGHFFTFQQP